MHVYTYKWWMALYPYIVGINLESIMNQTVGSLGGSNSEHNAKLGIQKYQTNKYVN